MARKGGLGPLGRVAIASAVAHAQAASTENLEETSGSTSAVVSEPLPEDETMPARWKDFNSSRVASAGYDSASQRLYVLFHKPFPEGTPWTYDGIQPNVWRNMRRVSSVGKFVNNTLNPITHGHPGQWGG